MNSDPPQTEDQNAAEYDLSLTSDRPHHARTETHDRGELALHRKSNARNKTQRVVLNPLSVSIDLYGPKQPLR